MTLVYEWDNIDILSHNTQTSPTKVKHFYDIDISIQDIVEYLTPYNLTTSVLTETETKSKQVIQHFMEKAIEFLRDNNAIDFDNLERDEYFVKFLKQKYEEKAWENWEKYYGTL